MSRKRKLKELTDADIAACEPESIWLETRACPLPAHIVLWSILAMLVFGIVWACVAKVDKVVAAEGKLVTTRPDITLKPLERSVVKSVDVRIGDVVEEGQTLITFDPTVNEAERRALQARVNALRAQSLRLEAEQNENEPAFSADGEQETAVRQQARLFRERRAFYNSRLACHDETIARYRALVDAVQESLNAYDELMRPMTRIEEMYTKLAEKGVVATATLYQVQMQRIGNEIEIEKQRASLIENKQMILNAQAEKQAFIDEWKRDIAAELAETQVSLTDAEEKLREAGFLARQETMKAPCRAVVHEIAPYQEGSGVREAEAVITLIPLGVPLEAQVDILPRDIGLLKRGDTARIKLDAFPFQQHGTLDGRITTLSANTYESNANAEENPNPADNGGRHAQYRARLSLSGALRGVAEEQVYQSGMKLRAEIKVGERRVISYLLNPFLKAMDESVREP